MATLNTRMTGYALCLAGRHGEHMLGDIVNTLMSFYSVFLISKEPISLWQ